MDQQAAHAVGKDEDVKQAEDELAQVFDPEPIGQGGELVGEDLVGSG